jgi:Second Messenger Oligonucleotide or Dinucleotide Synthetase domain
MTAVPSYFTDFLAEIRLTDAQQSACQEKHLELRRLLQLDPDLSAVIIDAFLQGSYRRETGVRPLKPSNGAEHLDVDLVVVTTLDPKAHTPDMVVTRLTPFLDRNFRGSWQRNDRSIKITFADTPVTLDLVTTAAPSMIQEAIKAAELRRPGTQRMLPLSRRKLDEPSDILTFRRALSEVRKAAGSDDWRQDALLIPDRELKTWVRTHPIAQIEWTTRKNSKTNQHYVNVVKAAKWWRRRNSRPEHPRGYPLEHLIGAMCPDGIDSVAEGLTRSFEAIVFRFKPGDKPALPDHGVPEHDVLKRVTVADFAAFLGLLRNAATLARRAMDSPTVPESASTWRELLGPEFPVPDGGGFTQRAAPSRIKTTGRYG